MPPVNQKPASMTGFSCVWQKYMIAK